MADIITAVDERVDATRCAGREDCQDGERCLTHELWMDLSDSLFQFLDSITLAQYVDRPMVPTLSKGHDGEKTRATDPVPETDAVN